MDRTIKLTIIIHNVDENTPDAVEFAEHIKEQYEVDVKIETEYDE